ncbi:hypothetical protein D3C79_1002330 [compost metagenome]
MLVREIVVNRRHRSLSLRRNVLHARTTDRAFAEQLGRGIHEVLAKLLLLPFAKRWRLLWLANGHIHSIGGGTTRHSSG